MDGLSCQILDSSSVSDMRPNTTFKSSSLGVGSGPSCSDITFSDLPASVLMCVIALLLSWKVEIHNSLSIQARGSTKIGRSPRSLSKDDDASLLPQLPSPRLPSLRADL